MDARILRRPRQPFRAGRRGGNEREAEVYEARVSERHAKSGITAPLPDIETFSNQYKGYEITIEIPEYTAICPKTGLPDFGTITIHYMPDKACLELKSLKMYIHAYRNIGIFYENSVNRILNDIATACRPVWVKVTGTFAARGGLRSVIEARYP